MLGEASANNLAWRTTMESKDTATNMRLEMKSDLRAMDPHHPDRSGQLDERFERMEWRIEGAFARLGKQIDGAFREHMWGIGQQIEAQIATTNQSQNMTPGESE